MAPRTSTKSETTAAEEDKNQRSTVQSLAKGFRVLEAFTAESDELTLSQIAAKAELDPGTTYRMLNTLVDLGYVSRIPESKRFSLTLKILNLGFHAIAHTDLRSLVRPVLRGLVSETSEAASFAVLQGADVLYLERVRAGITRLGVDIRIGTTVPACQTAIGQSILAFLPDHEVERIKELSSSTSFMSKSLSRPLSEVLEQIRKDGYIITESLFAEGLRILAVPVLDIDGYPVGAISIAAPAVRCTTEELERRALSVTIAAAKNIGRALQASGSINSSL
ncbi:MULTISPECIES: IclR family transcriptional regulator [Pseudomonas]|jgi:IclR family pca regulon transcriptional regulator|uniref:IclR family transcriptional regulator n=3 Tax=Pseudomonas TaxID=286 RepID=A0A5F0WI33_PSEPU|nr:MULTISPECIES: IclR family transcriptional regulator [Pseudomonas]HBK49834.1 IclR family transcriptional regulator [Pseudomonas sp.]AOX11790.1 IclR family transcriptional regulator [Pseudomonas putida JB]MBI6883873.1 IclR family transcriptional regulator [Pseudomonas putida]MDD1996728.1 IclR family transcriptional regulator [Pseudomonas putida]MDN4511031.1 IclR family transcriptional regulator [Pseudomonas sp. 2,4-D]